MTGTRECILYRWWDTDGTLLYVGKSVSLFSRIAAHRTSSAFFSSAAMMTLERFPDEKALADAEVKAIRTEHPAYNVAHSIPGGSPKKVVVADPDSLTSSHWADVKSSEIRWGTVLRLLGDSGVVLQGVVDDDLYECQECEEADDDCTAWIVWADDGSTVDVHDWEIDLYDSKQWVSLDANDVTKDEMFSRWFNLRDKALVLS